MKYLGGKSKIAKRLSAIIGDGDLLIEPFCGGGAMTTALSTQFKEVRAYDIHEDLILMWNAIKSGWVPPRYVSEQEYQILKNASPSALRGFVGFSCSFGAKWFGGYGRGRTITGRPRNYADEASRSLIKSAKLLSNVIFDLCDYRVIDPPTGCTVYADPPYAGTTGYNNSFDNAEFWATMNEWVDRGCRVFVSEYSAPEDWKCAVAIHRTRDLRSKITNAVKITEKLFTKE